jgi:hypothetical protein
MKRPKLTSGGPVFQFYRASRASGYIERPPHCAPQMTSSSLLFALVGPKVRSGFWLLVTKRNPGHPRARRVRYEAERAVSVLP